MVDLHCHILPGVDDGAIDLHDSVEMAKQAKAQGCRAVVASSHLGESLFDTNAALLRAEHKRLVTAFARQGVDLQVIPGAENFLADGDPGRFIEGAVPIGEGGHWVLFDFSMRHSPPGVSEAIEGLKRRGLGAIIAHPERNVGLMDDPTPLADWVARGALLQVNAASLLGLLGRDAQEMAEWLLVNGAAHLMASDAHDPVRRPFCLADGRKAAAELVGQAQADRLCAENPWAVVEGKDIPVDPLKLPSRSKGARLLRRLRRFGS